MWTHPRPGPWGQDYDGLSCAARPCRECGPLQVRSAGCKGAAGVRWTRHCIYSGEQEALLPQALAVAHAEAQGEGQGNGGWALGMSPRAFVHLSLSH